MLYLATITFTPENKAAFFKRERELMKKGLSEPPKGIKSINTWSSLKGRKLTALLEVDQPGALMELTDTWDDVADIDYDPVIPTADLPKLEFYKRKYSTAK